MPPANYDFVKRFLDKCGLALWVGEPGDIIHPTLAQVRAYRLTMRRRRGRR